MEIASFPVEDGSTVALVGLSPEDVPDDATAGPGVLGGLTDFLQSLLVDGVVIGGVGGMSWDLLKTLAGELRRRAIITDLPAPDLATVRSRIEDALADAGHTGAVVGEITQYADHGWEATGTVDRKAFSVRTDPLGQVIHFRVG